VQFTGELKSLVGATTLDEVFLALTGLTADEATMQEDAA